MRRTLICAALARPEKGSSFPPPSISLFAPPRRRKRRRRRRERSEGTSKGIATKEGVKGTFFPSCLRKLFLPFLPRVPRRRPPVRSVDGRRRPVRKMRGKWKTDPLYCNSNNKNISHCAFGAPLNCNDWQIKLCISKEMNICLPRSR